MNTINHNFEVSKNHQRGDICYREFNPILGKYYAYLVSKNRDVAEQLRPAFFSVI